MKKINVNSNCNGCGICLIVSKYFLENDEGLAEVKRNIVDEADLAQVENVIAQCPTSAIILREDMVSVNDKSAAIKNIISELKKSLNVVNIPRVKEKDMSFDIDKYTFPYPTSPNEITTDYKSEMSAKSGAKEDFNRLVYGEAARNTLTSPFRSRLIGRKLSAFREKITCRMCSSNNFLKTQVLWKAYGNMYVI